MQSVPDLKCGGGQCVGMGVSLGKLTRGPKQMKIWAKYLSVILQMSTILKMYIKLIPKEKGKPKTAAFQFPSREDTQRSWTFLATLAYVQVSVGLFLTQMTTFSWPLF